MNDFFKNLGFDDISNDRYVYFNIDDGSITAVSIEKDETKNFITVPEETVQRLLDGTDPFTMYNVEMDPKTKQLELKSKADFRINANSVKDLIYEIPTKFENADIQLVQSKKDTCWKFYLSKEFKQVLKQTGGNLNFMLSFSITKKGDPNVLYKSILINFSELVYNNYAIVPYTVDFEFDMKEVSVYTIKKFNSYSYTKEYE